MEIIIDCKSLPVGVDVVENELNILKEIAEKNELKVDKFVVTDELSQKINEFYGVDYFQATRKTGHDNITVLGKYCTNEKESILFFSPSIFNCQSASIRLFILLHELMHIFNEKRINDPPVPKFPYDYRLSMLYNLFDDYSADRLAIRCIDLLYPQKNDDWSAYNLSTIKGFETILLDTSNHIFFREKINLFRIGKISVVDYLAQTRQLISDLSMITVHLYALLHEYPNLSMSINLEDSRFVNKRADVLVKYLCTKFETSEIDLCDGVEIITEYLKNFGVFLEEMQSYLYCHILDI